MQRSRRPAPGAAAPACTPGSAGQGGGGGMLSTGPGPQHLRLSLGAASPAASSLGRNWALLAVQVTGLCRVTSKAMIVLPGWDTHTPRKPSSVLKAGCKIKCVAVPCRLEVTQVSSCPENGNFLSPARAVWSSSALTKCSLLGELCEHCQGNSKASRIITL